MKSIAGLFAVLCLMNAIAVAEVRDSRIPVQLPFEQRDMVLAEMRQFLSGLQQILAALSQDDMDAVAGVARSLGSSMTRHVPPELRQLLPEGFRRLGSSVHGDFDQIALDAESLGDSGHALEQLGETLSKCVACHETYQLRSE